MIVERKRLFLAGVGVLFPWLWLGGNTLFYAWIPGYHGSVTIFCFMVILGFGLATAASLTAKTNWRRRTLSLFFVQSILILQIALVLGLLYVSMGFGRTRGIFAYGFSI